MSENNQDKLLILWTSNNKETAFNMVFMYAGNAKKKGWWKEIILLIWGSSTKLVSEDEEIKNSIKLL